MDTDLHQIIRSNQSLSEEHCQVRRGVLTLSSELVHHSLCQFGFYFNCSVCNIRVWHALCSISFIRFSEDWNTYILPMSFIETWNRAIYCLMQIVILKYVTLGLLGQLRKMNVWRNMLSQDGIEHLSFYWTLIIQLLLISGLLVASFWSLWTEGLYSQEGIMCIRCDY